MYALTPQWIMDFETSLHAVIESSWSSVAANLKWDRIASVLPTPSRSARIFFLLDSAGIQPEGLGGNKRYDEIAGKSFLIENERSGSALQLTRDHVNDGIIKLDSGDEMPLLDYAGKWAADQAASAAYWPEKRVIELLTQGHVRMGYDGKPFFSTNHDVHPFKSGLGSYSNLRTGNLTPNQFAQAVAQIKTIKGANGEIRKLSPSKIIIPSMAKKAALELFQAKFLAAHPGGSNDNVFSDMLQWGVTEIVEMPELPDDAFYIVCDGGGSVGMAGIIYSEREPYTLNSFSDMSSVELSRQNLLEYHFSGRNGIGYGHPFLIHKFNKPAGQAWGVDP